MVLKESRGALHMQIHALAEEINLNKENGGFMMEGRLKLQRIMSLCHECA